MARSANFRPAVNFNLQLTQFRRNQRERLKRAYETIAFDLKGRVIQETPVGDPIGGFLQNSWDIIKVGNSWVIFNPLPYARVAEFGEWTPGPPEITKVTPQGFSKKAPDGMARISIVAISGEIRNGTYIFGF
jgi:hypothetical protein